MPELTNFSPTQKNDQKTDFTLSIDSKFNAKLKSLYRDISILVSSINEIQIYAPAWLALTISFGIELFLDERGTVRAFEINQFKS